MLEFATNNLKKTAVLEALRLQVLCADPTEMERDIRDEILAGMRHLVRSISRRDPLSRYPTAPGGDTPYAETRRRAKL
jgi:hypothetical protein